MRFIQKLVKNKQK